MNYADYVKNAGQTGNGGGDIPMGFGMALAQNSPAMMRFAGLPEEERRAIVAGTHAIRSKDEMRDYVEKINLR